MYELPSFPVVHVGYLNLKEPAGAASMQAALAEGASIDLAHVDTFVDGATVRQVGTLTLPLVRDLVDEVVTVPEGAVCSEMLDLYQTKGIIAEPAGDLASTVARLAIVPVSGPMVYIVTTAWRLHPRALLSGGVARGVSRERRDSFR
jgi:threonine dehydratase